MTFHWILKPSTVLLHLPVGNHYLAKSTSRQVGHHYLARILFTDSTRCVSASDSFRFTKGHIASCFHGASTMV
ncbi:hypothetical protein Q3G72_003716 [Acer saccharum]|nr:hypothetical protein Q3G72_003716 [Acer saccharum]